jgi:hypothetical protein
MNTERLLKLADYLETVVAKLPPERFHMEAWGVRADCGTTCCAVGHACDIPEFKALGLHLWWPSVEPDDHQKAEPALNGERGSDVVASFFDISSEDVDYLFTEEGYWDSFSWGKDHGDEVTVEDVVYRIRDFVRFGNAVAELQ